MLGPLTQEDKGAETVARADDLAKQILGRAVDPMQILDYERGRRSAATRLKQAAKSRARVRSPIKTPSSKPASAPSRWRKAEKIEHQGEAFPGTAFRAPSDSASSLRTTSLFGLASAQSERAAHHFDERHEGRLLPVRRTFACENEDSRSAETKAELMQQSRFTDSGLADDVNDAKLPARRLQISLQDIELALTPGRKEKGAALCGGGKAGRIGPEVRRA